MHEYAIVEFLKERTVGMVCISWLIDESQCYWPNKNVRVCQLKKLPPAQDWQIWDCRILDKASNYEEARRMLVRSEEFSDLKSDKDSTRRRRKKRHFSSDEDSSPASDQENRKTLKKKKRSLAPAEVYSYEPSQQRTPLTAAFKESNAIPSHSQSPTIPAPISIPVAQTMRNPSTSSGRGPLIYKDPSYNIRGNSPEGFLPRQETVDYVTKADFEAFQGKLFSVLADIKVSLIETKGTLKSVNMAINAPVINPMPEDAPTLPLRSEGDAMQMEQWLSSKENQQYLVQHLALIGGKDVGEATRRIMSHLMTNGLAANYNWAGRGEKGAFSSLKLKDIVLAAAMHYHGSDKQHSVSAVEEQIKQWLKCAKQRSLVNKNV